MTPIAGFAMTDWSHAIPQRGVTECYNALKSARNVGITLLQVSWENPFTSILIEFSDHTGAQIEKPLLDPAGCQRRISRGSAETIRVSSFSRRLRGRVG
jgi:hypothetical protein